MKYFRIIAAVSVVAVCMSLPMPAHAVDVQSLSQQAQQAASAGKTTRALGLYELALRQSADQPESVSGPLLGQYWRLIGQSADFPRGYDFFSALLSEQKTPGATLLATEASAAGTYLGWLYQNNLAGSVSPAMLTEMDASARKNYARALALDPDNFAALYGYAIYESYIPTPTAKAHMQQLLARLNSLRTSHPQYPWALVEYLEQHGHPQM